MIATPISDSPAISPLDTGTVEVSAVFVDVRATSHARGRRHHPGRCPAERAESSLFQPNCSATEILLSADLSARFGHYLDRRSPPYLAPHARPFVKDLLAMMRISLDSPALTSVRSLLAGLTGQPTPRAGRSGRRKGSRLHFCGEQLEPRMMLDAGMRALLPDLVAESDTGASNSDNVTFDRTPELTGSVRGAVSQVRLFIDGRRGDLLPVTNGTWTHEVPATAALTPGRHTFAVRPVHTSGRVGPLSLPLNVTVVTAAPNVPTLGVGPLSDSGVKGDGQTTFATPMLRGIAQPGRWVNVSIDDVPVGRVRSDAKTGAWLLKSPQLANGVHDVTAVVENRAGLESAATTFSLTVNGPRTVMLDATGGQTVELTASHLLGQGSQGFVVTQVLRGTLQKWVAAKNAWVTIPAKAMSNTDPVSLQKAAAIRKIAFNDVVRWTPARGDVGTAPVFGMCPSDTAGGPTAPTPGAGTVPGRLVSPSIDYTAGVGSKITWGAPTDGYGSAGTRYSIEVTREDGQTLLYNLPSGIGEVAGVGGGRVTHAKLWGATKTGAGEPRTYDPFLEQRIKSRLSYTVSTNFTGMPLRAEARAQLAGSPTGVNGSQTSFVLGGSNASLAYVEVSAVPDAVEAAQGLAAETRPIVSTESNKLTAAEKAELTENPILARSLFPGTVNGEVQPDHARVHFQAGEKLQIAGNVDTSVASRATIVVEEAPILANNSLGHWYAKARLPVAAGGGFAYDHEVQYGMTAVRVRLEVAQASPVAARTMTSTMSVGATASDQTVSQTPITLDYDAFGITTAPWQVANNQGFDRNGNYYNSNYTGGSTKDTVYGTPITYNGISFPLGQIPSDDSQVGGSKGPQNFVQAKGQTITVDMVDPSNDTAGVHARQHDFLYLAGAASNGNQLSQKITLTFTDGTTETWTQSFTDWSNNGSSAAPQPLSGEFLIESQPERINQEGDLKPIPAYIFAYGYNLRGKQLAGITLPNNENVGILSAVVAQAPAIQVGEVVSHVLGQMNLTGVDLLQVTIKNESNLGAGGGPLTFFFADNPEAGSVATESTPATYTQKQVTVPMGQQKTITYVGPDSFSQLTFYVQKADGTCVGPNCSTYLPDWKSGSGSSSKWAANISPSLNSQVKSGQSWTMTIANAGLGYWGFLDSPAGQSLPNPSGSTPGGAQFQLMTQAEITTQPPWMRELDVVVGELVGLAIIAVATGGTGDVAIVAADVAEDVAADAAEEVAAEEGADAAVDAQPWGSIAGDGVTDENVAVDRFVQSEIQASGQVGLFFSDISADGPEVDEVARGVWADEAGDVDAAVQAEIDALDEPMIVEVDDVPFRAAWEAVRVDAEAEAEKEMQRAIQKVMQQAMGKAFF